MAEMMQMGSCPSTRKERILRFSCRLLSGFLLSLSLFLFCFIFYTYFILKVFSFLSPLLITTIILILLLLVISPESIRDELSESSSSSVFRIVPVVLQLLRVETKNKDEEWRQSAVINAYTRIFGGSIISPEESQVDGFQIESKEESLVPCQVDSSPITEDKSSAPFNGALAQRSDSSTIFSDTSLMSTLFEDKEIVEEEMWWDKEISEKEVKVLFSDKNSEKFDGEGTGKAVRSEEGEPRARWFDHVKSYKVILDVSSVDPGPDSATTSLEKSKEQFLFSEDCDDEVLKSSIEEDDSLFQLNHKFIDEAERTELNVATKTIDETDIVEGLRWAEKEDKLLSTVADFDKVEGKTGKGALTSGDGRCRYIADENGSLESIELVKPNTKVSRNGAGAVQPHPQSSAGGGSSYYENSEHSPSMNSEKEWRRTLACKLFEERHNVKGEGMDLLWEVYDETDSEKPFLGSISRAKTNRADMFTRSPSELSRYHESEYEQHLDGNLCCLEALKFSAGKMNLGVRGSKLRGISKVLKGIGWLRKATKHSKKARH